MWQNEANEGRHKAIGVLGRRDEMGLDLRKVGDEGVETTVDQALIRGLVTAFRATVSGFPLPRGRAPSKARPHN